jgi:hypothetical protein
MDGIFSYALEPVVKIDENVCILTESGRTYARVTCIEAIPEIIRDFGAISAGGETGFVEITDIQVNMKNQFAQIRFFPIDNIEIYVNQPQSCQKWASTKTTARVSKFIEEYNGPCCGNFNLTEIFQHGTQGLYFNVKNPDTVDITKSRVLFFGFVYTYEKLDTKPAQYTVIPMVACGAVGCGGV